MRHSKHRHVLGVKKAHRVALMANLAAALMRHERIQTTLAKAKALRPFMERIITLAKKAAQSDNVAEKLHYRRLAIARVRDVSAVSVLFDERAQQFLARPGGYTRIYKLIQRRGDGAPMALIETISADDAGYSSKRPKTKTASKPQAAVKPAKKKAPEKKPKASVETSEK